MWADEAVNTLADFMKMIQFPSHEPRIDEELRQNSIPVVIKQIRESTEKELIEMFSTKNVTVVGQLVRREIQSTRVIYTIEDDTGLIRCIWQPPNAGEEAAALPPVKEGENVRAIGPLKAHGDSERFLMLVNISPMTEDFGRTDHIVDVMGVRMLALLNKDFGTVPRNSNMNLLEGIPMGNTDILIDILNPLRKKVFDLMKSGSSTKTGMSRKTILESFDPSEHEDVKEAIKFLTDKAYAYCTVDNDHFKIDAALLVKDANKP